MADRRKTHRDPAGDRADPQLDDTFRNRPIGRAPTAAENVVVIGLGRFGSQVAQSLLRLGHEVLGLDRDERTVQHWADRLTHVVQTDSTDNEALLQLGLVEFRRAVVGIGNDLEASVLTVLTLVEIGVEEIWAKATSAKHGKILSSVGASHVIYPEAAMGDRVAHLITTKMLDFTELDEGFAIAKVFAPPELSDRRVDQAGFAREHGVMVVAVRNQAGEFECAHPETMVPADGTLIVAGRTELVQKFAADS